MKLEDYFNIFYSAGVTKFPENPGRIFNDFYKMANIYDNKLHFDNVKDLYDKVWRSHVVELGKDIGWIKHPKIDVWLPVELNSRKRMPILTQSKKSFPKPIPKPIIKPAINRDEIGYYLNYFYKNGTKYFPSRNTKKFQKYPEYEYFYNKFRSTNKATHYGLSGVETLDLNPIKYLLGPNVSDYKLTLGSNHPVKWIRYINQWAPITCGGIVSSDNDIIQAEIDACNNEYDNRRKNSNVKTLEFVNNIVDTRKKQFDKNNFDEIYKYLPESEIYFDFGRKKSRKRIKK